MADWWPLVFSLAQVTHAACLIHVSNRVSRVLELKPRHFSHIVCKPGDVVCIALPSGLSPTETARARQIAKRFQEEAAVTLHVFEDGFQIIGATE